MYSDVLVMVLEDGDNPAQEENTHVVFESNKKAFSCLYDLLISTMKRDCNSTLSHTVSRTVTFMIDRQIAVL